MKLRKVFTIIALTLFVVLAAFYLYIHPRYVVPILMYHHIDEKGALSSLSVSPENFLRQMEFLRRNNYNAISLSGFVQAKLGGMSLPRNTVVITFDDGYEDNYTCAYPVLQRYNLPATIFMIVDSINQEGYLTETQMETMLASGVIEIGSHTLSGDYLPGKSSRQLKQEIGDSRRILQERLNKKVDLLAYPIGGFSPEIQEIVKSYGYRAACTTNRGRAQSALNNDILALKRIKIKDGFANLFVFWVKISGYYNLFRSVKAPY